MHPLTRLASEVHSQYIILQTTTSLVSSRLGRLNLRAGGQVAITRRAFVLGVSMAGLGVAAGCAPVLPWVQRRPRPKRIGYLNSNSTSTGNTDLAPFVDGLRELGYLQGRDYVLETRYADGQPERLDELASELVQLPVDVLVTVASPAAIAAKQATSTIPVVFTLVNDPVTQGLVKNLARPGGNLTGLSTLSGTVSGKRVELIRETLPGLSRLAVIWNTTNPGMALALEQTAEAARSLGLEVQPLGAAPADDLNVAFAAAAKHGAEAVVVLPTIGVVAVQHAEAYRLPTIYSDRTNVDAGGLMSLGPNYDSIRRRAASYVDRIMRGTPPAELPIEQPSSFDFVVNLRAAGALGLDIPKTVLLQATEVLE
jgi:putative tryptophan/tyrosine transport system substrate-binding protein